MGVYYFAVDYNKKEQMWAPLNFSDKCIYYPGHPLPAMVAMKNGRGFAFKFVNDMSTEEEHEFKDVTKEVYEEWKKEFPEFDWDEYEKDRKK